MNDQSGLIGVLAPAGFQVNGVIVTAAPDVPAKSPDKVEGDPTVSSWKLKNLVAVTRLLLSVVADPENDMFPFIEVGMAYRLPVNAVKSSACTAMGRYWLVFIRCGYLFSFWCGFMEVTFMITFSRF